MKNIIIILSLICLLFAIPTKGQSQMELYVECQSLQNFIAGDGYLWGNIKYEENSKWIGGEPFTFRDSPIIRASMPVRNSFINRIRGRGKYGFKGVSVPRQPRRYFPECRVRITVDEDCPHFTIVSGVLFNRDKTILVAYLAEKVEYVVPSSITTIGDFAFSNSDISNIVLPSNLATIGNYAFRGCRNLTHINIPYSVINIGDRAFSGSGLTVFEIPSTISTISNGMLSNTNLSSIEIPENIVAIGASAFANNPQLSYVSIPNSVKHIGANAFRNSGLTSFAIPSTISTISAGMLSYTNLLSIEIPENIVTIGAFAFANNSYLSYASIPNSVERIGLAAFRNSGLVSFTIPTAMDTINPETFSGTRLSSIEIPENIVSIGRSAFVNNPYLRYVSIPRSVRYIGAFAFGNCTNLVSINFPDGMNDSIIIKENAFFNTPWLDSIVNNREGNAVYIGTVLYKYKWESSNKTEIIYVREGTRSIVSRAFYRTHHNPRFIHMRYTPHIPHSIVIPNSVWYIGKDAMNIHNLKRLYVNWTSLDSLKINVAFRPIMSGVIGEAK